jgi:hypothetical protein
MEVCSTVTPSCKLTIPIRNKVLLCVSDTGGFVVQGLPSYYLIVNSPKRDLDRVFQLDSVAAIDKVQTARPERGQIGDSSKYENSIAFGVVSRFDLIIHLLDFILQDAIAVNSLRYRYVHTNPPLF